MGRDQKSKVLLWTVPTQVAGKWVWQGSVGLFELELDQVFQKLTGTLVIGGRRATIEKTTLSGEQIGFEASLGQDERLVFSGKVIHNAIEGEMRVAGASQKWNATRTELRDPRFTDLNPGVTAR